MSTTSIAVTTALMQEEIGPESSPLNAFPIVKNASASDPQGDQAQQANPGQDHEMEEDTRRRLDEWRSMAANLSGGFTQMPDQVRKDPTLSTSEKVVYEHLLGYMWAKEWCWPSQKRIAEELGISRRTVIRACKELYARCYIEKWRRGLGRTNVYFVNPLSFVTSFKKPGRGAGVLLQANGPERQATIESTPVPDVLLSHAVMCQKVTSRSDTMAQAEAPNLHTKHTKTEINNLIDIDSNHSSGPQKGTGRGGLAIGIDQQDTIPNKKGTKDTNASNATQASKTNNKPKEEEQAALPRAGAAGTAKAAKQPSAQAQAIAAGTGIPAAHLAEMGIAQEPPRRSVPDFIARIMDDYTRELGDNPRSAKSNITRATKLYYFALDYIKEAQEDPEGFYIDQLYLAKNAARNVSNIRYRTGSRINRIPVFFKCLENIFELTPDELAYMRSDLPLLEPEDR